MGGTGVSGGSAGSGGIAGSGGNAGSAGAGGDDMDAGMVDVFDGYVCPRESDMSFCERQMKNCGNFTAANNCNDGVTVNCGTCTAPATCGGDGTLNSCTGGPINRAYLPTAAGAEAGAPAGVITTSTMTDKVNEERFRIFDNKTNTKWFVSGVATPWIAFQFPNDASYAIQTYTVTSANDRPARDPKNWRLEGSNDLTTWTVLDTRADQTFAQRFQTNTYSFPNTTAYRAYRFFVTGNNGEGAFQISELQLFENLPPRPEAGAPDAAEAGPPVDAGSPADAGNPGDAAEASTGEDATVDQGGGNAEDAAGE